MINTNRLILREVRYDDIPDIHALHSLPAVDEYNTLGLPQSLDETISVIKPAISDQANEVRKIFCWSIISQQNKQFIGICGLSNSADRFKMGEIYYKLLPDHWGNGYATEVSRALVKYGFSELGLHRIEAGVATENKASIRVLEKIGMTNEGIRRKILPIRGEWKDNYHFAIVEDDPRDY
jgi:RimJ/RimL family protein N-acetyltransferase